MTSYEILSLPLPANPKPFGRDSPLPRRSYLRNCPLFQVPPDSRRNNGLWLRRGHRLYHERAGRVDRGGPLHWRNPFICRRFDSRGTGNHPKKTVSLRVGPSPKSSKSSMDLKGTPPECSGPVHQYDLQTTVTMKKSKTPLRRIQAPASSLASHP